MSLSRRTLLATAAVATAAPRARAQTKPVFRIGVLNDKTGAFHDIGGALSVVCAQQAVAEFASLMQGYTVEVITADHQNKPDVAAGIARQWLDNNDVDMITDLPQSAAALAVAAICKEKNKVCIPTAAAVTDLTGPQCAETTVHWAGDTWMLAKSTGGALVKAGGGSWFFVTADVAFGHVLENDTTAVVKGAGGVVKGSVAYPFPQTTEFSSFLVQAQNSGAKVLGLANSGADTVTAVKQAKEFGLTMDIAPMVLYINDINGMGLDVAQGLYVTETFYWDLNAGTRAFTQRILPRSPSNYPSMVPAGVYASSLHFMKAINKIGPAAAKASGKAIVEAMKSLPTEDDAYGHGSIRQDGRALFPAYLFQVKKPSESRGAWDYYKLVQTTPADQAFRPLALGGCPFIKV